MNNKYLDFVTARDFVRSQNIHNIGHWVKWSRNNKPSNQCYNMKIHKNNDLVKFAKYIYKNDGIKLVRKYNMLQKVPIIGVMR